MLLIGYHWLLSIGVYKVGRIVRCHAPPLLRDNTNFYTWFLSKGAGSCQVWRCRCMSKSWKCFSFRGACQILNEPVSWTSWRLEMPCYLSNKFTTNGSGGVWACAGGNGLPAVERIDSQSTAVACGVSEWYNVLWLQGGVHLQNIVFMTASDAQIDTAAAVEGGVIWNIN